MNLSAIDWIIIAGYFAVVLVVGVLTSRRASGSAAEFFLGGRSMPWWLLGVSMVATTFAADTPNLVTDIVRNDGVSGNWVWWAFLLTGMLTVFVYAKLWRRCGVLTDLEFYELRYSGRPAAFLRGFRALYLGLFFNLMIMATVSLAAIKIGAVLMGFSPLKTILLAMTVTLIYSGLGGLRAVLVTDFLLFSFALTGSVMAAVFACRHPQVGGLAGLFNHANVADKLHLIPVVRNDDGVRLLETFVPVFLIPLTVQWWSAWYAGSEPGGGGYMAQRMLSARDENGAVSATLLFNICHYAVRPWPWILVALASLVLFPDAASIARQFPHLDPAIIKEDIAYPAMLTLLPPGILGIAAASLLAAYMSTMSTHLNWGASYMVHDFYQRFFRPQAGQKELVMAGRLSTLLLLLLAGVGAFLFSNALQAFHLLLQVGAGTGLIFILRWFWWRINAWSEITAMIVSFLFALYIEVIHPALGFEAWPVYLRLTAGVGITTVCWLVATLLTRPTDKHRLRAFYRLARPGGPGWNPVLRAAQQEGEAIEKTPAGDLTRGILCMMAGCVLVYSLIFASGYFLYGRWTEAIVFTATALVSLGFLFFIRKKTPKPIKTPAQGKEIPDGQRNTAEIS